MSTPLQIRLRPPPGVSFTQWADGTIVFSYSPETIMPLRAVLEHTSRELVTIAIEIKQAQRLAEIERHRLPKTPEQILADEICELQALADKGAPDSIPFAPEDVPSPENDEIPSTQH